MDQGNRDMLLRKPSSVDQEMCHCQGLCDGHEEPVTRHLPCDEVTNPSRRSLLRGTLATAAAGVLASVGAEFSAPRSARAQSTMSPEAALQALLDGNTRFVERRLSFYEEDLAILKQNTA